MGEYLSEGGWTYLDGLEAAQQVERIGKKIMELGGVRATDYTHKRCEAGHHVDVCVEEIANSLSSKRALSLELRALKSKGLAQVVRKEGEARLLALGSTRYGWMDADPSRGVDPVFAVQMFFRERQKKHTY